MHRTLCNTFASISLTMVLVAGTAHAGEYSSITVGEEEVQVYRDDFGRPHIFAETNIGLFTAAGYVAAQDRLWQMELNRRAARGTLAAAFGAGSLSSDVLVRTIGYTDAELDAQVAELALEDQQALQAYVDGVNRYLGEARQDPYGKLPWEFFAAKVGAPADFSVRDSVAFIGFLMRRFAETGGSDLANKQMLDALTAKHGPAAGYAIFKDLRWLNDPAAPATIPAEGAVGKRQHKDHDADGSQLERKDDLVAPDEKEIDEHWHKLGVPTRLGSYGWVVSPTKSENGKAMLYGGPQMGFAAPEIVHEVQLQSEEGINVTGMTMAGIPWIVIGRNNHIAWTMTTGIAGDNVDSYIEMTCDAGGGAGSGYFFKGACKPYEVRREVIAVRGAAPTTVIVRRSVHGPVVAAFGPYAATQKRAHWMRELSSAAAMADMNRAHNLRQFERAVRGVAIALNFFYADRVGNIGYWLSGLNPLRQPGFDRRLPLPGDGSAEWLDGYLPIPRSINPAQGFLANWNNKPTADYPDGDGSVVFNPEPFGPMHRYNDLAEQFQKPLISVQDMRDIPKDIARVNAQNRDGRQARFLLPFLFAALDAVPARHPLAAAARSVLAGWDGSMFADSVTSTTMLPGQVIFATWLGRVLNNTFADELGTLLPQATPNALLHALQAAKGGGSSVAVSRDYFNGVDAYVVLSRSFDEAVYGLTNALGFNPAAWVSPRGTLPLNHALLGAIAKIPVANRSTYGQIVQLEPDGIVSENIISLGQSGMIRVGPGGLPSFDAHYFDQLPLFTRFEYKPMPLYHDADDVENGDH